jgi:uncharacterized protein (TIGR02246 family)
VNADGTPMTSAGYYMSVATRVDGAWKLTGVVTNFNATPPEGMAYVESTDTEPPPEEGTMADMVAAYETHFNLGHAGMVADLYTDDAIAALANRSAVEGRAAIEALMSERMAAGSPQIDLHDVGTWDLGEGWAVDGGWYSMTATGPDGPVATMGAYMSLVQQQADGTWKIHRVVTNSQPAPAG